MTALQKANAGLTRPLVAAAFLIVGLLGGSFAQSLGASSLLSVAPDPVCHVGPVAGPYICTTTVIVDAAPSPSPSPSPSAAPSPVATPTAVPPTATPVVSPTPAPTPSPTAKPTASPLAGIPVPASIDKTGNADDTSALNAFLNGQPANTTVVFPAGGIYRITAALKLSGRTNLTLVGNGATIKITGTGFNENFSLFYLSGSANTGITITGFNLVGDSTSPGRFIAGEEGQMCVLVDGAKNTVVTGITCSGVYGDGIEVNSGANGVHVTGNAIVSAGRNALSVIWGSNVEFDHNVITASGYVTFDVEPNTASEPSSAINIHDNVGGTWSDAFFAVDGSSTGAAIHDLTVANNTSATGLLSIVNPSGKAREQRIAITGNIGPSSSGPVVTAHAVDGLTVTGNTPARSGSFLSAVSCTGVTGQ